MTRSAKSLCWGLTVLATALAAGTARADRFSFGLGVSNGEGGYFSFGMSNGGGGRHGGHYSGHHGYYAPCAPRPVVCAPVPVYVPRPVVCAPPPVVVAPAPVVYAQPAVQTVVVHSGYWVEREQRVWVEGYWVESVDAFGRRCKTWQPGRWELRRTREWVQQ